MSKTSFIYVMSNPAFPGLIKIGRTDRHPDERARELQTTGVPSPFNVEFCVSVGSDDSVAIEYEIHDALQRQRCESNREFFVCGVNKAIVCIMNKLSVYADYGLTTQDTELVVSEDTILAWGEKFETHPFMIVSAIEDIPDTTMSALIVASERKMEIRNLRKDRRETQKLLTHEVST